MNLLNTYTDCTRRQVPDAEPPHSLFFTRGNGSYLAIGFSAWFWDESEVVDGFLFYAPRKALGVKLPILARFTCFSYGGLKVVYNYL